jgi:hypothetical protein
VKSLVAACLLILCRLGHAEAFKPFQVISISGTATLTRFEDENWPLEAGQQLPGDFTLALEPGALIQLRALKRVDIALAGPAQLKSFVLEHQTGDLVDHDLVLRLEKGEALVDPRFLLKRPSQIRFDLPDAQFELKGGSPTAMSVDPGRPTRHATDDPRLKALAEAPVPVLLLARDYDSEMKTWPKPAILGPAMYKALEGIPGLRLVEGSGDTKLAYFSNNAIKTGKDFFLQDLARERGARFVIVGNLVSEQLREDSLSQKPIMSAVAEFRVLEAHPGGDVIVNDTATTLMARGNKHLELAGLHVLRMAANRAAAYLKDDIAGLLKGEPHPAQLLKVTFNNVKESWSGELRQGLGRLPSVSRFFKRGFASGVFRADVILRKSEPIFLGQLMAVPFKAFVLELEDEPGEDSLVFTLRKGPDPTLIPTPTPVPTPKRPLDWRK